MLSAKVLFPTCLSIPPLPIPLISSKNVLIGFTTFLRGPCKEMIMFFTIHAPPKRIHPPPKSFIAINVYAVINQQWQHNGTSIIRVFCFVFGVGGNG